ncbi:MAG: dihydrofolate reductase [Rikenellaceae bacterium]
MTTSIIVAIAKNRVIGKDNSLIWHISEDLRYFKRITTAHTIIMGRKSYESIGRPLPNRRNIVVSRNSDYSAAGCECVTSIESAIELCKDEQEIFIIGGGEIYKSTLPLADKLYITEVKHDYEGDTFFPEIDFSQWKEISRESYERGEKYEYPFDFVVYERENN